MAAAAAARRRWQLAVSVAVGSGGGSLAAAAAAARQRRRHRQRGCAAVAAAVGVTTKPAATRPTANVRFAVDVEEAHTRTQTTKLDQRAPIKMAIGRDQRAPIKMVSGRAWSPGIYRALRLYSGTACHLYSYSVLSLRLGSWGWERQGRY